MHHHLVVEDLSIVLWLHLFRFFVQKDEMLRKISTFINIPLISRPESAKNNVRELLNAGRAGRVSFVITSNGSGLCFFIRHLLIRPFQRFQHD